MDMDDPIFSAPVVVQALVGGLAATAIGSMMAGNKGQPQTPSAPSVTPPTPMPTPGDASAEAARKASIASQLRRQGRASTILTDPATADTAVTSPGQAINTTLGG